MTVVLVATAQRFIGNSFDPMPDAQDVPEGSTFHVIDSGEEWIRHDGTWEKDLRPVK